MSFTVNTHCRACGGELDTVMELGDLYPSRFLDTDESPINGKVPLTLAQCQRCDLVQLHHTVELDLLYRNYWYKSGLNQSMQKALFDVAKSAMLYARLQEEDVVVDIACFPEGKILIEGYIPKDISEIQLGDKVHDVSGSTTSVTKKYERYYEGELVVIRVAHGSSPIRVTPEHSILVVKNPVHHPMSQSKRLNLLRNTSPKWISSTYVEVGDYVVLPTPQLFDGESTIDLSHHLDCFYDQEQIFAKQTLQNGKIEHAHNQNPLPRYIQADYDFARLLGLYMADGSGRGKFGTVSFALHKDESEYVAFIKETLETYFGLSSSVKENSGNSVAVVVNNTQLKSLLQLWFGKNAYEKHLPIWMTQQSIEFTAGFIRGFFDGDGSETRDCVKLDTISPVLAEQLRGLLLRLGVTATIVRNKPNGYGKKNGKTLLSVRVFGDGADTLLSKIGIQESSVKCGGTRRLERSPRFEDYQLLRVNSVDCETYSGNVYNLETQSHSYVVDNFVVHNCNDGTLLSYYAPFAVTRIGFDPALNIAREAEIHSDLFINDYFTAAAYPLKQKAKIITSIAMFYDLPDPSTFAQDVRSILHPDGIWIIQLSDLVSMLQHNAFDAICHEHLEYYSLSWLVGFLSTFSLDVFQVEYNDVNGGSLRLYICHTGARDIQPMVETQLRAEQMYLSSFPDPMRAFKARIYGFEFMTLHLLHQLRDERKSVYGMAASTKGNTLLQMYGIDSRLIQKIADVNPDKFGCHTIGSNIEIISEQEALFQQPDYFFLLAWHFLPFFVEKHRPYLESGGRFIVPLPEPRIYSFENGELGWRSIEKAQQRS